MDLTNKIMEAIIELSNIITDYSFPVIETGMESYFKNYDNCKHDSDSIVMFDSHISNIKNRLDYVFLDERYLKEILEKIILLISCENYSNDEGVIMDLFNYMM